MVYTIRVQYMSERTVQYIYAINNNKTLYAGEASMCMAMAEKSD